jgi:aquaporin related protein
VDELFDSRAEAILTDSSHRPRFSDTRCKSTVALAQISAVTLLTLAFAPLRSVKFEPLAAKGGGLANITVTFVALSYGIGLLTAAWVLYRVSGGLFNPAITLGMVLAGALPPLRGLILFPAQCLGAICAAAVVSCIAPVDIDMVQTKLAPDTSVAQGVFLEMVCTAATTVTTYGALC